MWQPSLSDYELESFTKIVQQNIMCKISARSKMGGDGMSKKIINYKMHNGTVVEW